MDTKLVFPQGSKKSDLYQRGQNSHAHKNDFTLVSLNYGLQNCEIAQTVKG